MVRKNCYALVIFALQISLSLACSPTSPSAAENAVSIPTIYVECKSEQSLDCNSNAANLNKTIFVGIMADDSSDCATELANVSTSDFYSYFIASGNGISEFNGALEATVDHWYGDSGAPVVSFDNTSHRVCAFIDTNGNGRPDSTETKGELVFTPSDQLAVIKDWF